MSIRKTLSTAAFCSFVFMPISAFAADGGGAGSYFSFGVGITNPDDIEQKTVIAPFSGATSFTLPAGFDTSFEKGVNVNAIIGHKFNSVWRIEGEYKYSRSDIDATTTRGGFNVPTATNPSGALTPNEGEASVHAVFGNLAFDIDTRSKLTPYLGVGVGVAQADISSIGVQNAGTGFAYQVFGGADVAIDDRSWFGARFNLMNTADFEYDPVGLDSVANAFTLGEGNYSAFDVTFSYRRSFK